MLSGFELYPRWVPLIAVLARKCHRHDCQCQRGECMGSSSPPPLVSVVGSFSSDPLDFA